MSRAFAFGILVWAGVCVAQSRNEQASLWIQISASGLQNSSLTLPREAPPGLAEAFAEAVGCQPSDLIRAYRPEVNCLPSWTRWGLKSTARFPLSRLTGALDAAGIKEVGLYISHSGRGISRVSPAMESTHGIFGWSHNDTMNVGDLHDVELETGFEERNAWLLALAALVTGLSPLLLIGLRGEIPTLMAGVRWIVIVISTAWLWTLLFTDGPALTAVAVSELPGPALVWQVMAILLPMAVGVWLGLLILAAKYERVLPPKQAAQRQKLLLWAGVAGSGILLAFAGMLGGGESIFPLGTTGLLIFLIGILQRYRTARGSVSQIGEGPLLDRIRQLATRAGTHVKAVKLIRSDSDTPAAFADRRGGILLSRALLRDLSRSEVDAIVAHELSHIRHNHAAQVRGWLMVLPIAIGVSLIVPGVAQWTALLLPTCFLTFMAVRRKQELTADADAARWSGEPEALIRGLARATKGTGVPFHWGRFVGLVIAHPPTSQRFQALGTLAGVSPGRVQEIVTSVDAPAEPGYEVPGLTEADPVGNVAQTRAHLKLLLGWMSLLFPMVYSAVVAIAVRVETLSWVVLAAAELAGGIVLFYLLYEWMIARARSRVRDAMRKRLAEEGVESPGFFTGFSPAAWPALYEGMYDFEWGFVAFEGERIILRGERGTFSVKREEVARIWRDPGPAAWTAKPMLCFELVHQPEDRPRGFSVRPFDGSFGPMAAGAARKLLDAATAWHRDNTTGSCAEQGISLYDYPNPVGVPDLPYSWSRLLKGMMKLSGYVVVGVATLQFYVSQEWRAEPLLISVLVLWGLVIFMTWPTMRRSS